ncbi:MAG: hypothetical protein OES79_07270 [Planctomycetota bacterium]|nr:hypothetical protein [Planctomycetota bacterium]
MIPRPLMRFLERLRFPYLFVIMLVLLAVDLLTIDPIPFVDEILLAVGTLLLASIRKRKTESEMTLDAQTENDQ